MNLFVGFSSQHSNSGFDTRLYGSDLIKADIINHFQIRKGEIRGRPNFGSLLYNFVGQPFDEISKIAIQNDVNEVLYNEKRINVKNINIETGIDSISFTCTINYAGTTVNDFWNIFIDNQGRVSIK